MRDRWLGIWLVALAAPAALPGCCVAFDDDFSYTYCDRSTFVAHCEGNVAVSCVGDRYTVSGVMRRACTGACTAAGGSVACTAVPLTPCAGTMVCSPDGRAVVGCVEVDGRSYLGDDRTECPAGTACVQDGDWADCLPPHT